MIGLSPAGRNFVSLSCYLQMTVAPTVIAGCETLQPEKTRMAVPVSFSRGLADQPWPLFPQKPNDNDVIVGAI